MLGNMGCSIKSTIITYCTACLHCLKQLRLPHTTHPASLNHPQSGPRLLPTPPSCMSVCPSAPVTPSQSVPVMVGFVPMVASWPWCRYFDFTSVNSAGVCAAETLLSALASAPAQSSHFATVADLATLLKLLSTDLPLRTRHLACCVLSLLLRPVRMIWGLGWGCGSWLVLAASSKQFLFVRISYRCPIILG